MATRQFIYHMRGLSKTYPAGKKVLDNVNLSSTRMPKSACSASMARASRRSCASWLGWTPNSSVRASSPRAPEVGYLPQEPDLDPALDVKGNAMLGSQGEAGDPRPL